MSYQHGIFVQESPTSSSTPLQSLSTIPVIIGTAPVNLLKNPGTAVNVPILAKTYDEAVAGVGYSDDFDNYTLCQAIDIFFKKFKVGPVILINILDPAVHKTSVSSSSVSITNGIAKINITGVLLDDTFIVKDTTGTTTYVKNTDYTVAFDSNGYPVISVISGEAIGTASSLQVSYTKLDTSKVVESDIIGSYTAATNTYKGIECISEVYPMFNLVPGLLLAPGWSQDKDVAASLKGKSSAINGCFNAEVLLDIDTTTAKIYTDAIAYKNSNGFTDKRELVLWPKIKIDDKIYWYSVIMAALILSIDISNNDVPFKSPSNKKIAISAAVLADGTEVFLDLLQANELNAVGIVTVLNMAGWRTWGNNTGCYPDDTDSKDRFIAIRRLFDWWGNQFITDFFNKVDDPTNYRLIESIVDEENIKANGYQAAGQIAGAKISFSEADNSIENIANGQIQFTQSIGAFAPAESITDTLIFDPTIVSGALTGGGQ